ncbi:hypothetical protein DFH09DRAFT_1272422 [Mycena vulgaris]|nr:hypothetical protein DFH09DRAFT_1272422 [Mycena vulgaris]
MSRAALEFGEVGRDVLFSTRPLIVALFPGQQRSLDRLKTMREQLSKEVVEVITTFGPRLYDDFNQVGLDFNLQSTCPTVQWLWRGGGGNGAVDAQGLGLTLLMIWLDEHLFGWSRSSNRGTSAWAGTSTEASRIGSPNDSEEEDTRIPAGVR